EEARVREDVATHPHDVADRDEDVERRRANRPVPAQGFGGRDDQWETAREKEIPQIEDAAREGDAADLRVERVRQDVAVVPETKGGERDHGTDIGDEPATPDARLEGASEQTRSEETESEQWTVGASERGDDRHRGGCPEPAALLGQQGCRRGSREER